MSRTHAVLVGLVAAAGATSLAFAAGLAVSSERVTVYTSTTQLPLVDCVVTATADAYIDEATELLSTNFGTATTLHVRSQDLADKRALVRFDLTACGIPSSATVKAATLRLTVTTAPGSSRTYNVHRAVADWTETGVTWSNQPSMASSATASAAVDASSARVEWDVAADVAGFVAGTTTNLGWRVRDAVENAALGVETRFAAREHATTDARPRLVVRWHR